MPSRRSVGLALDLSSPAEDAPSVTFVGASNVCMAVSSKSVSSPVAIVRARSIRKDYQRKGAFRIGVMPTLAVEAFRFEVFV
jgi:hypothetical protein